MSELKPLPCPFCGGEPELHNNSSETLYGVYCPACGAQTAHEGFTAGDDAIAAWNHRTQPNQLPAATKLMPNEPLTIDDIKTLDYEPIWVEDISGCNTSCWAIAGRTRGSGIELYDEHCGEHYIDFAAWDNYGKTWVAYRRKPEGVDHHA